MKKFITVFHTVFGLTLASLTVFTNTALAGENDPCAGLTGKAKGLCTAYTEGMGCNTDNALATPEACDNVATMFEETTGSPPPSLCPCDFSVERINGVTEGWMGESFYCREMDTFDAARQTGVSQTLLAEEGAGTDLEGARTQIDSIAAPVWASCTYISDGVVENHEFSDSELPLEDLVEIYEACRGAISTLSANTNAVPDDTQPCNF